MAAVAVTIGNDGNRMALVSFAQTHILAGEAFLNVRGPDVQGVES